MSTRTTDAKPTNRRRRRAAIGAGIGTVAIATAAVAGLSITPVTAGGGADSIDTIEVDIAEDGTRFVIDETPVFDDGFPAHGNPFITQGYIYPAGTLTADNGVNPDGTAEFPDQVIGEWSCTGYFIGEGAHATEGAWVYTTQLFAFGDDAASGTETIVVVGYEGAEVGAIVTGAITGGTGEYATASGEAAQELLGINNPDLPTMGINKTVEISIHQA